MSESLIWLITLRVIWGTDSGAECPPCPETLASPYWSLHFIVSFYRVSCVPVGPLVLVVQEFGEYCGESIMLGQAQNSEGARQQVFANECRLGSKLHQRLFIFKLSFIGENGGMARLEVVRLFRSGNNCRLALIKTFKIGGIFREVVVALRLDKSHVMFCPWF